MKLKSLNSVPPTKPPSEVIASCNTLTSLPNNSSSSLHDSPAATISNLTQKTVETRLRNIIHSHKHYFEFYHFTLGLKSCNHESYLVQRYEKLVLKMLLSPDKYVMHNLGLMNLIGVTQDRYRSIIVM
ncbi:hypothetical protein RND71_015686 [Anisodus tanguticus]|uniref:Uncharacterized protein n=1 Tax=Anisodus tanguticus TaxID=243964 RepID=A0AAE1VC17_9SOLA|nr:hypothetical protein RND71_015686 [Anisodus tanguticus]